MIGSTIGKYRIVGQLGRGGAGIVYHAVDETLGRDVAIKVLNPDLVNAEVMARFRAEATILARLNHPGIATIYELYQAEADLLMVMELLRGETLDALSARVGPMPPERAASLVDQVLTALEHAHRAGVVHRDMKPANVMVNEAGSVKIMDFGIARVRGAEQMTVDGRLMGTPAYMPPEQVLGQDVDGRADLYAVGVVFYRLLTGVLPLTAESPVGMLQRQVSDAPTPLERHRADLPPWCQAIVDRALAKDAGDRFQTAEAFRAALAAALGQPPAPGALAGIAPPAITDTLDLSRLVERTAPVAAPAVPVARRRHSWAYAMLVIVAVSAVAAYGYLALRPPAVETAMAAPAPGSPPPKTRATTPARPVSIAAAAEALSTGTAPSSRPRGAEPPAATPSRRPAPPASPEPEARLVFETRTIVGTKKPREHDAHLVLDDGLVVVTPHVDSEYPYYSVPYRSVLSISYSRGRDPLWNSPTGPAPVIRAGGTLGRIGIVFARDWIALRTSTADQFVPMRFDEVLLRRVLLALEERTGRRAERVAEAEESQ